MFLVNGQKIQLFSMKNDLYTIGVEEEYMICDHNGDLSDKANMIMKLVEANDKDVKKFLLFESDR